jgi:hypothetical protein
MAVELLGPEYQRIKVSFGMRSDLLKPEEITASLGICPSHAFAKGDEYSSYSGTRKRPTGVWQLRSEDAVSSSDLKDHLLYILGILEPRRDLIQSYINDRNYYVDIRIWWEGSNAIGSFTVSSDIFARLASLCKEFNCSFIAKGARKGEKDVS